MNKHLQFLTVGGILSLSASLGVVCPVVAQQGLFLAYPPTEHETTASQIFLIGSASPEGEVLINGKPIQRSSMGHFAPSFPLEMGENRFRIRYGNQEVKVTVTRVSNLPSIPAGVAFATDSFTPGRDISRLPGELICFGAIAPANGQVSLRLGNENIPLTAQPQNVQLPPNSAVLTAQNEPNVISEIREYSGCTTVEKPGNLGNPVYQLSLGGKTVTQQSPGNVTILAPTNLAVVEVTADAGVARTGPTTNYSRLTPLPKGTIAAVTGREGDWLRLDYGAWIRENETQVIATNVPPKSLIRSITSRQVAGATEIIFPLQSPVPVSINQGEQTFTLKLHNVIAQTDTIRLDDDPLIKRLDWQVPTPGEIEYTFHLKSPQQWGYDLRYEGTSLILSLRHSPAQISQSLSGIKILLDPGHGGQELGARGPNGYPEKDVNLAVAKLLQEELKRRGATVYMTRESDVNVSLADRVAMIQEVQPAIALSVHYNALPDSGDAVNTAGVGMFWYHTQAHDLAVFLHNYLVEKLNRPSYGVFWNNLALTRPHIAPAVLMELGFMINPVEFEWVSDRQAQRQLANTLAEGIVEWFREVNESR
ncbi:N-acetylmuramoyl-L-alanine amidase [Oscillatoria salina]|uniref:N-acetylmuramoyl-L-alanine amidase n=1 Tax=Oscillatoria salina TaxID=331517 RepID=UPI001CCE7B64|nr:N-acetylmuramoyl-L-alanine amidase [Oscillatoria salina]MBZ8182676.1 N-acetylmuramoyl-L-alanine amidase [Oscillatoria salina IIICB1]